MANGLELLELYEEKRNVALEAFLADADRIKKAIDKDRVKGRSPVKLEGDRAYKFVIVGKPIRIAGKEEALQFLAELVKAAYDESDTDFRAAIDEAYGEPVVEKQRRGRRKAA